MFTKLILITTLSNKKVFGLLVSGVALVMMITLELRSSLIVRSVVSKSQNDVKKS